jgi:hypothetical protein
LLNDHVGSYRPDAPKWLEQIKNACRTNNEMMEFVCSRHGCTTKFQQPGDVGLGAHIQAGFWAEVMRVTVWQLKNGTLLVDQLN